jgi:hypothetical protein
MSVKPKLRRASFRRAVLGNSPVRSQAARAELHRTLQRIRRKHRISWDEIFAAAFGKQTHFGAGFIDNFRAGKIAHRHALKLHLWVQRKHPDQMASYRKRVALSHLWQLKTRRIGVKSRYSRPKYLGW